MSNPVQKASLLVTGEPIKSESKLDVASGQTLITLDIPKDAPDEYVSVIKLVVSGAVSMDPAFMQLSDGKVIMDTYNATIHDVEDVPGKPIKAIDMKMFTVPDRRPLQPGEITGPWDYQMYKKSGEGIMPGRAITVSGFQTKGQALSWDLSGLLSIWILGMYNPSPETTVVIPFKPGDESILGPIVNDAYFGKVPAEYLKVEPERLFFRGDGTRRGKIGISPQRSQGIAGSYDAAGRVLNIVTYNVQESPNGFVNSMWELQEKPYAGDAVNAYNDGSPEPGAAPLGPFYELETSSPAAALKPGQTMKHVQRTFHFHGSEEKLSAIAQRLLGVSLDSIKAAF